MKTLEERVAIAVKFIKLYKKNIRFIKSRIEIQNKEGYNPYYYGSLKERQYNQFDIDLQLTKLNNVKQKLEEL